MNKYTQDMTGTGDHVELPDPGPEPERYYDWMLWKLRQEPEWMEIKQKMAQKKTTIIADMVNHPPHYNKGIETTEYINSYDMGFSQGNVIKYVTRYNLKHSDLRKQREDLAKAKWYLNDLIVELEKKIK